MPNALADLPVADPKAFEYQCALVEGIEQHVRLLRRRQLRSLTYHGADLGRAIAIELYFRLVNDPDLRHAYERFAAGETLSTTPDEIPVSTVAYWVLTQMIDRRPMASSPAAYLRASVATWGRTRKPKPRVTSTKTSCIAILTLSRRFRDYLRPIADAVSAPVLWLAPAGSDVAAELATAGERVAVYDPAPDHPAASDVPVPLRDWPALTHLLDRFREILGTANARAVVMAEGNSTSDELLARAAATLGIRSVCIQQGWAPLVHNGFRNMAFDAFCVWGPDFATMLAPYNPRQAFPVTGNPHIGPMPAKRNPGADGISFFLQKDTVVISSAAWEQMMRLVEWTAETWPHRPVLVRPHPAIPLTDEEEARLRAPDNVMFCPASEMPLTEVLDRSVVAVAILSTTLLEAVARHVVPLIVNVTGAPRHNPDLEALGVGVEVHDYEGAKTAMRRLLDGEAARIRDRMPAVIPRFFAEPTDAAVDAVVDIVENRADRKAGGASIAARHAEVLESAG